MRAFFIGLQFLTRIRLVRQTEWTMQDFGRSVKYFPLVGLVLGAIYGLLAYGLLVLLPARGLVIPPHIDAVFFLALPILMTGGLHCDGFMDTMDGVFSGRSRERMLEIMKDSRVGATGVTAFVLLLLFQGAVLLDFSSPWRLIEALFLMPVLARLMMSFVIIFFPYARPEGMGKAFAEYANHRSFVVALIFSLCASAPWGSYAFLAMGISFLFTIFFARYITRILGGLTGDVYGAVTTLNECLVLLVFLFV